MHVEKQKIIDGIIRYIEKDVMPEISSDRGFQVVISIGVSAIKANNKLLDKLFENDVFKSLANYDDENKTYDIDLLCNIAKDSVSKCGYFPVKIPAISFIGVITFICSAMGVKTGSVFGCRYRSGAEFAGGIILIIIGVKILLDGLGIL